jgi:hypothetical protein
MFDFSINIPNIPIIPNIVDYKYYFILVNYSYLISISLEVSHEFVVHIYTLYDISYLFFSFTLGLQFLWKLRD